VGFEKAAENWVMAAGLHTEHWILIQDKINAWNVPTFLWYVNIHKAWLT